MKSTIFYVGILLSVFLCASGSGLAQTTPQDSSRSIILRSYIPPINDQLIRPSRTEYQLWQDFMLVRNANDGDPAAEHELGLRYFLGEGFQKDTVRAAYWIAKAADQKMSIAEYNYGVFLNNGWGLRWDPFKAFDEFKAAADVQLPEAELALGLMYTDNLVVPRNWSKAYELVKKAADAKYAPARRVLDELIKRGIAASQDSASKAEVGSDSSSARAVAAFEPVYLDFGTDTTSQVDDSTIIQQAYSRGGKMLVSALPSGGIGAFQPNRNSSSIETVERAANLGDPEALIILGRCYEKGTGVPKDLILAAEQYLRAARMDSRQAIMLLVQLVKEKTFDSEVESRTKKGDSDAAFVWAGLTELGFDNRLDGHQAFELLVFGAAHGNIPSLLELGRCYYTGQWTTVDTTKGKQCWLKAAEGGSVEASVRLAAAAVLADSASADSGTASVLSRTLVDTIRILSSASDDGSLIAQLALGYCFENGVGMPRNTPEAVRLYRECADHGNRSAYEALVAMYDRIRPEKSEFQIKPGAD